MSNQSEFTQREWLEIFPVLENLRRYNMLIYLSKEGPVTHSELAEKFELDQNPERYASQINALMRVGLARPDYKRWREEHISDASRAFGIHPKPDEMYVKITEKGMKVLEILREYPS